VIAGECADEAPSELTAEDRLEPIPGAGARFRGRARRAGTLLE
jgi:hypothetical protein